MLPVHRLTCAVPGFSMKNDEHKSIEKPMLFVLNSVFTVHRYGLYKKRSG